MTFVQMAKHISKKTGYDEKVVRYILDELLTLIKSSLVQQGEVYFPGVMRVTSEMREMKIPIGEAETILLGDAEPTIRYRMKPMTKLILKVRPVRSFRKELNKWTSMP